MKRIFLSILLAAFSLNANSQEIEKNEVDDFTGAKIIETSWEKFNKDTWDFKARIRQIDDRYYFEVKFILGFTGSVFSISKEDPIMLKLENGSMVELYPKEYTLTCEGCGATGLTGGANQGMHARYVVTKEQLQELQMYRVEKYRIYTSDGYVEDDLKKKRRVVIQNLANLILNQ